MAEYTSLEKIRLQKIEQLRQEGVDPYPTRAERTHTNLEAITAFEKGGEVSGTEIQVTLAGRIRGVRPMGKVSFAHIEDGSGRMQLFFRMNEIGQSRSIS
jgi:lysyl-tRNA synthetase class 2